MGRYSGRETEGDIGWGKEIRVREGEGDIVGKEGEGDRGWGRRGG